MAARVLKPGWRSRRNIKWCSDRIRVPEGKFVGQKLRMPGYMKRDFELIYDNPAETRMAILTRGRKNAKTTEAAMILLLHLCGPEAKPHSQLYSTALSRDQAAVLFALAAKMVRMDEKLSEAITIRDSAKQLLFQNMGTVYRALSAEASTAYGLSPVLTIHDELGQVRGPRSPLFEALETATAAQENPLSIIISTQAPTENDLLSRLIDDAQRAEDPKLVVRIDTAPEEMDPFSEEAIKAANPAFNIFMNKAEVLSMAASAQRMPSRQAEYENLILNRRVEASNPLFGKQVWLECGGPVIRDFKNLPVYGGLDLSATTDLTALVLIAPHEQKWHVKPTFWLPEEGLRERARKDRVEYDLWHAEGLLETTPGRSVDYEFVAEHLRGLFDQMDIRRIGFDRWAWVHFRRWLLNAGFDEQDLEEHFVPFGQGYQSMSPALRDLEADVISGKIVHGNHSVLTMCAANAVVHQDPAGNRKLDKAKSRGRIDGLVALTMARGVASTEVLTPKPKPQLFIIGGRPIT
jgi:phage terminase large subunit-like protein